MKLFTVTFVRVSDSRLTKTLKRYAAWLVPGREAGQNSPPSLEVS